MRGVGWLPVKPLSPSAAGLGSFENSDDDDSQFGWLKNDVKLLGNTGGITKTAGVDSRPSLNLGSTSLGDNMSLAFRRQYFPNESVETSEQIVKGSRPAPGSFIKRDGSGNITNNTDQH